MEVKLYKCDSYWSFQRGTIEKTDGDIKICYFMEISKYVIFGIPSTYFNMNEKMLGNERSLTVKEWENLIFKSGGKVVEKTSFHYYNTFRRLFEIKKWLKPKAFLLFVIEKNNQIL